MNVRNTRKSTVHQTRAQHSCNWKLMSVRATKKGDTHSKEEEEEWIYSTTKRYIIHVNACTFFIIRLVLKGYRSIIINIVVVLPMLHVCVCECLFMLFFIRFQMWWWTIGHRSRHWLTVIKYAEYWKTVAQKSVSVREGEREKEKQREVESEQAREKQKISYKFIHNFA